MKWIVVSAIVAVFVLLALRILRPLTVRHGTIHIAHMKSKEDAAEVARILEGIRGVVEVSVDLDQHYARITYRKGKVTVEDMLQALHAGGF